jgi:HEPN domain-containing protein
MEPHLEEAWRALRLADHDIKAFEILSRDPEAHISSVCFHAQQAVEKSLKAVLFSRQIGFERTHDLVKLAHILADHGLVPPVADDDLRRLNPFAVTLRYDEVEIELISRNDSSEVVVHIRLWAEEHIRVATDSAESETNNSPNDD